MNLNKPESKPKAKAGSAKTPKKSKGLWQAQNDLPLTELVEETRRALTFKKLQILKAAHDAWWKAAHGNDEKAYARTRDALYTLVTEYLPELIALSHNTLLVRAG